MVTHIMKDGTVLTDISGVTVPQDIVKTIVDIALDVRKEKKHGKGNDTCGSSKKE